LRAFKDRATESDIVLLWLMPLLIDLGRPRTVTC